MSRERTVGRAANAYSPGVSDAANDFYEQAISDNMFDGKPFGHANDDWERLKDKMQPGDELWYFQPPNKRVMQFWGLALVRGAQVISTVITGVT